MNHYVSKLYSNIFSLKITTTTPILISSFCPKISSLVLTKQKCKQWSNKTVLEWSPKHPLDLRNHYSYFTFSEWPHATLIYFWLWRKQTPIERNMFLFLRQLLRSIPTPYSSRFHLKTRVFLITPFLVFSLIYTSMFFLHLFTLFLLHLYIYIFPMT